MDAIVRAQLPQRLVELVDQIEGYAGMDIQVGVRAGGGGPGVQLSAAHALIMFPDPAAIDVNAMRHELLHILRNWPEQVPLLFSNSGHLPIEQNVAYIDNVLEHLVIVPMEWDYGAVDPYARWNAISGAWWMGQQWLNSHPDSRRMNLLLWWLTVAFLATDLPLRQAAKVALNNLGLWNEAEQFAAHIGAALHDKAELTAITAYYLQIPLQHIVLRRYNVQTGAELDQPVAPWHP